MERKEVKKICDFAVGGTVVFGIVSAALYFFHVWGDTTCAFMIFFAMLAVITSNARKRKQYICLALFAVSILWMCLGKLDIAVKASGRAYYLAEATMDTERFVDGNGANVGLKAGMACEAKIITGEENIMSYALRKLNLLVGR